MLQLQRSCLPSILRTNIIVLLLVAGISQSAHAQTYKVIHNFTVNGGATPYAGPVFGPAGNLYGTVYTGGAYGSGGVD